MITSQSQLDDYVLELIRTAVNQDRTEAGRVPVMAGNLQGPPDYRSGAADVVVSSLLVQDVSVGWPVVQFVRYPGDDYATEVSRRSHRCTYYVETWNPKDANSPNGQAVNTLGDELNEITRYLTSEVGADDTYSKGLALEPPYGTITRMDEIVSAVLEPRVGMQLHFAYWYYDTPRNAGLVESVGITSVLSDSQIIVIEDEALEVSANG